MKKHTITTCLIAIATGWFATMAFAIPESAEKGVVLEGTACPVREFSVGARLFTDRNYVASAMPELLEGMMFLRTSIHGESFTCAEAGTLYALSPTPGRKGAAAGESDLLASGFTKIDSREYQLFGKKPIDQVTIYRKVVAKGDPLEFGKWVILLGRDLSLRQPVAKPWNENVGELLYNGIRLPEEWPPRNINPFARKPMQVPYLESPPQVIPINIGRQLFVDDFLIEETDLERRFHQPEKYEGNPLLSPETDLELNGELSDAAVPKSGGVWWDPADHIFKMWYEAGWLNTICYATSSDGLHWTRPVLDVNPGTNQVLPMGLRADSWTVVPNWNATDPEQRYKMFLRPPGAHGAGYCLTSADGIHWEQHGKTGECGDRSTMFYNPFREKWVYSLRSSWQGRTRDYREHDDFLTGGKWSKSDKVKWAYADEKDIPDPVIQRDCQLYNLDAVAYESLMLGFYEIHRGPPNGDRKKVGLPKITELNFAYSRDGFHWYRPDREAHISAERRDVWDRGYVQSIGNICTVQGDQLWFYYSGFQGDGEKLDPALQKNGMYNHGATGVAFLRRDGFVSMNAEAKKGTLVTRPITFSGSHLFVNLDAPDGCLKVEALDETGQVIEPFTLENCEPVTGDHTRRAVQWQGADNLDALAGRSVQFRFQLQNGELYAFWVSPSANGASFGYVAGGGPEFTGSIDTVGNSIRKQSK